MPDIGMTQSPTEKSALMKSEGAGSTITYAGYATSSTSKDLHHGTKKGVTETTSISSKEAVCTGDDYNNASTDHGNENNDNNRTKETSSSTFRLLTHNLAGSKKYALIPIVVGSFLTNLAFSLISPFYPNVAVQKGMDLTTIGVVFGIFEIVMFLTAPVFGYCLGKLGPKFVYIAGIFIGGSCNVLFGSLAYCPGGTPFIALSLLIRATAAVGASATETSSFAIMSNEFKTNVGMIIGILRTSSGFGMMLGPTVGAAFYELNGFALPFYVTGGAVLLNGAVAYKFVPSDQEKQDQQLSTAATKRKKGGPSSGLLGMLRSPMVVIPMLSVFVGMMGLTTYESTFSRHLQPLHLSIGMIGVIFGVFALVFSVMSMVWGYISDSKNVQAPIIVVGHLIFALGYLILGPSGLFPFLRFNLVTIVVGLACVGVSLGCTFVPTMKCMVIGAVELGFEDNIDTYGIVSGLFTSIQTLGGFVGPVGFGYLIQELGFPAAYTIFAGCNVLLMVVSLVFFTTRHLKRRKTRKSTEVDVVVVEDVLHSSTQLLRPTN